MKAIDKKHNMCYYLNISYERTIIEMKIYSVLDKEFAPYGKVLQGYDTAGLMKALDEKTPLPEGVEYVMSDTALETVAIFGELQNNAYGGMPPFLYTATFDDVLPCSIIRFTSLIFSAKKNKNDEITRKNIV